jgi:hypothetical protein
MAGNHRRALPRQRAVRTLEDRTRLCLTGITAPWVLDGPMDGDAFRTYVQHVLAPTLRRGGIVVLDNLPAHNVVGVREAAGVRHCGLCGLTGAH